MPARRKTWSVSIRPGKGKEELQEKNPSPAETNASILETPLASRDKSSPAPEQAETSERAIAGVSLEEGTQRDSWQKGLQAIRRAWRDLGRAVSGKILLSERPSGRCQIRPVKRKRGG